MKQSPWTELANSAMNSFIKNLEQELFTRHKLMRAITGLPEPPPPTKEEIARMKELDKVYAAAHKRVRQLDLHNAVRTIASDGGIIFNDASNHWDSKRFEYGSTEYDSYYYVQADDGTPLFNDGDIFRDGPWVERAIAYAKELDAKENAERNSVTGYKPEPTLSDEEYHAKQMAQFDRWED